MIDINAYAPHVWLILSSLGIALAVMSLIEAISDFLVTKPTNGFRALAIGDILTESIRLIMYTGFGGLGIWAVFQRVHPDGAWVWVLVAGIVLMIVKTIIQMIVRRYVRRTHVIETNLQAEDREAGVIRRAREDPDGPTTR